MAIVQYDQDEAQKAASGVRFTAKPEGKYTLRVDSWEVKPPKEQGKYPMLVTKCTIMWSSHGKHLGDTITRRLTFHPKSVPYNLIPFLKAGGVPFQMQNGALNFDENSVIGVITTVECRHEKGDRSIFENWENDEPHQQQGMQPQSFNPGFQQPVMQPMQQMAPQQPQGGWGAPPQQQGYPQQPVQQPMMQPQQQPQWGPPPNGQPVQQPVQPQQPAWMQGHVAGQGQPQSSFERRE